MWQVLKLAQSGLSCSRRRGCEGRALCLTFRRSRLSLVGAWQTCHLEEFTCHCAADLVEVAAYLAAFVSLAEDACRCSGTARREMVLTIHSLDLSRILSCCSRLNKSQDLLLFLRKSRVKELSECRKVGRLTADSNCLQRRKFWLPRCTSAVQCLQFREGVRATVG